MAVAAVLMSGRATAQTPPDTLQQRPEVFLPQIEIIGSRHPFGGAVRRIRTISIQRLGASGLASLEDVLSDRTALDIRRVGWTGAVTASMRGAGARQTTVMLDGFQLANPQTGTIDLSLLPSAIVGRIDIIHGPSGSGPGLGGSIRLISPDAEHIPTAMSLSIGSFERRRMALSVSGTRQESVPDRRSGMRSRSGVVKGALSVQTDRTNGSFRFVDEASFPARRSERHGAGKQSISIAGQSSVEFDSGQLRGTALFTDVVRGVPGPANARPIRAVQHDELARVQLSGSHRLGANRLEAGLSHAHVRLRYSHPTAGSSAMRSEVTQARLGLTILRGSTWIADVETAWSAESSRLPAAAHDLAAVGLSGGAGRHSRRQLHTSADVTWSGRRLAAEASMALFFFAEEVAAETQVLPSIGFRWRPVHERSVALRVSAGRSYRNPTMNELYWVPGGNPALRPESGYSLDAGLAWDVRWGSFHVHTDVGVYAAELQDKVIWQPGLAGPGVRVWQPANVGKTLLRGVEAGTVASLDRGGLWQLNLHISRTESLDRTDPTTRSFDQQLRYVPELEAGSTLSWNRNVWEGRLSVRYTGRRFTSSDETVHLDAHHTMNASIGRTITTEEARIGLRLSARNLENTRYEIISQYPMPPRHFAFTLSITSNRQRR